MKSVSHYSNDALFRLASFLSRPPGFYILMATMAGLSLLLPFGLTEFVTYILSVAAIIITGIVLLQGYRDTAAIHAKLDEIVIALKETRNDVVGLEHAQASEIREHLEVLEKEAEEQMSVARPWPQEERKS